MPDEVRTKMERAFGTDFSAVRIHEGPQSEALGARGYTRGTDIHFAPGQYQPGSHQGQRLLGHELTHVVQQSEGRVRATTQAKGQAVNDDSSLERQADEMGAKAARGQRVSAAFGNPVQQKPGGVRPSVRAGGLQRSGAAVVQRERLARGTIPEKLDEVAALTAGSMGAWNASGGEGRERDTFVGVTSIAESAEEYGNFEMYACFNESKLDPGQPKPTKDNRILTTNKNGESTRKEVKDAYKDRYIEKPSNGLFGGIDGYFHWNACNKSRIPQTEAIGWSIRASKASPSGMIRFVSGRNLGKFVSKERHKVANREGRDMPKAWAQWITKILKRDLKLKLSGWGMGQTTTSTGKVARKRTIKGLNN